MSKKGVYNTIEIQAWKREKMETKYILFF